MVSSAQLLSLREILRCRRELRGPEASLLLRTLPELLDEKGAGLPGTLVNEVVVCFDQPPSNGTDQLARQPVREWPSHRLSLRALEDPDAAGGATMMGRPIVATPSAQLAALLYELLGGRVRGEELLKGTYAPPLASVDELANVVLRKALSKRGFSTCRAFWVEWAKLVPPEGGAAASAAPEVEEAPVDDVTYDLPLPVAAPPPKPRVAEPGWTIPAHLLDRAHPAQVLELTVMDGEVPPTRLVARAVFRIGRSRRLSDVPARSASDGGTGEALKELSRVHTIGESTGAGIGFRDGNGERPSANGSTWNDVRLYPNRPEPITGEGRLVLSPTSCRYSLEVLPRPLTGLARRLIANLTSWRGASVAAAPVTSPFGAVTFRHPPSAMVVRESVWLLAALGAEVTPSGEFAWTDDESPSQAFLHRHGCFWVVNHNGTADGLRLDGTSLAVKEIAPLAPGQVLEIGGVKFKLATE